MCVSGGFAKRLNRSGGSVIGRYGFGRGGFTYSLVVWGSICYLTGSRIHTGNITHSSGMNSRDGKKREDPILEHASYGQFVGIAN